MKNFHWDSNYIYIMMEYCGGGDLSRYIKTHQRLPEKICRRFLQQLGAALKFLRQQDIAHMDLKPQNILLSLNSPKILGPVLKLADFGFAQYFTSEETKHALRGSPLYMAPEMVLDRKYDAKVHNRMNYSLLAPCLNIKF
jgi:serine/threonine protein kinase